MVETLCRISSTNLPCEGKVRIPLNDIWDNTGTGGWSGMQSIMCPVPSAGISGKGPAGGESSDAPAGAGGAFARMSDVIPPLPSPHATTDDDDWEA